MLDIKAIRGQFPQLSLQVHGKPLVYLDSGATAQKPLRVIEKTDYIQRQLNANIHRGVHYLSEQVTLEYERARETVTSFINAASTREVIFTSGATAAINTVAYSMGQDYIGHGDNVIVSQMEHHSNIVPWQIVCGMKGAQIKVLPFDDQGRLMSEMLPGLIDERTRIVAVTQASNVLGTQPDIEAICSTAHSAGVPVLVDGCQGIVHTQTDVQALGCDFYVFSGHKLYGPTGTGVLYGKEEWLEKLPPFMGGGDMVSSVSFDGTVFADLPFKFEAGTANYTGAIGMAEAIRWFGELDFAAVMQHEEQLLRSMMQRLGQLEAVKVYGTTPGKCPIVSFNIAGASPLDTGMILDKQGVAIRTGTHCAQPVMEHYGVGGMCRASMAVYNTAQEVEIFASALERAVKMLT